MMLQLALKLLLFISDLLPKETQDVKFKKKKCFQDEGNVLKREVYQKLKIVGFLHLRRFQKGR